MTRNNSWTSTFKPEASMPKAMFSQTGNVVTGNKSVSIQGDAVSGDKKTVHDGDLVEGDKYVITKPQPVLPSPHQLPPPPADFTGRTAELHELRAAIAEGRVHIWGLYGQGGVGKTALALKLAEELSPNYPDAQNLPRLQRRQRKTPHRRRGHVPRPPHLPSRSQVPRKRRRSPRPVSLRPPQQARPAANGQRSKR